MKQRRIGILTFHFCDNYGAVLQCYALKEAINKLENCYAEVINFKGNWSRPWFTETDLDTKYLEKEQRFNEFRRQYLNVSPEYMDANQLEQLEGFDGFIVGSDQVWNPMFKTFHKAYFLDFAKDNTTKISYAASVALPVNDPKLRLNKKIFETYIPRFDFLSVRENTHEAFIQQYTDKKVKTVLDPTLLLESEDYNKLISKKQKGTEKFIFMYVLKHDSTAPLLLSFVNVLARSYHLKVIHFFVDLPANIISNKTESFYFDGPEDFIWYIKNAEIVITNSFHGTVFSILYKKAFYTYIVQNMGSRVFSLLSALGLEDRIIQGYKNISDVELTIGYENVYEKLSALREESLDFLWKALL